MKHKYQKRRILAVVVCLLALAALVGLGALVGKLLFSGKSGPNMTQLSNVQAVELPESWAQYLATDAKKEDKTAYLETLVQRVKSTGANTILLTGWLDDDGVLFRNGKKDSQPAVAAGIAEADGFFQKYDPLKELIALVNEAGMQIALVANDEDGLPIIDATGALPEYLAAAASAYKLTVYADFPPVGWDENRPVPQVTQYVSFSEDAPTLLRQDVSAGTLAAAWQADKTCGLVLGSLTDIEADPSYALLVLAYTAPVAPSLTAPEAEPSEATTELMTLHIPQTLSFLSPDPANLASGDAVYLIGTSDPSLPVTINGQEPNVRSENGVFGIALPLNAGDNNYSAVQGDQTVTIVVRKSSGTGGTSVARPDGSVAATTGQKLRITTTLASMLSDYTNNDAIVMTAYQGGIATVQDSVAFTRGTQKTYAYKLQNGSYVLAKDCELLPSGTAGASFDGVAHSTEGNMEALEFSGSGTPIFEHNWSGNSFSIQFFSASFTGELPESFGFEGAIASVTRGTESFTLNFQFSDADPLYGYHVDYTETGSIRLVLKHQPKRSADPAKPLSGIAVLLDPGHGDTDMGAFGCPDPTVPQEKDVNLALGLAARTRLEQLGATVIMTRDTDVFYTLGERVEMLNTAKPDFFISLHHNSTVLNRDVSELWGTECYWFYTNGKQLAQQLVSQVCYATGRVERGTFYEYFYVTRSNICPAVLLETGFVSNPIEFDDCTQDNTIWRTGAAVAEAVLACLPE